MISAAERLRFDRICRDCITSEHERYGIGTLGEKMLHNILKNYFSDSTACQEQRIFPTSPNDDPDSRERRFIADILWGCDIIEIQTGSLYPLREKLDFYLNETDYRVTVVHPLAVKKWLTWIEPDGSFGERHRSSAIDRPRDIIPELYSVIEHISNRRFSLLFPLLVTEEFKLKKRPRGRGSSRKFECFPIELVDIIEISTPSDLLPFLPEGLPDHFTASEFGRLAHYYGLDIYSAIKVFCAAGLITECGTRGRAKEYVRL